MGWRMRIGCAFGRPELLAADEQQAEDHRLTRSGVAQSGGRWRR